MSRSGLWDFERAEDSAEYNHEISYFQLSRLWDAVILVFRLRSYSHFARTLQSISSGQIWNYGFQTLRPPFTSRRWFAKRMLKTTDLTESRLIWSASRMKRSQRTGCRVGLTFYSMFLFKLFDTFMCRSKSLNFTSYNFCPFSTVWKLQRASCVLVNSKNVLSTELKLHKHRSIGGYKLCNLYSSNSLHLLYE